MTQVPHSIPAGDALEEALNSLKCHVCGGEMTWVSEKQWFLHDEQPADHPAHSFEGPLIDAVWRAARGAPEGDETRRLPPEVVGALLIAHTELRFTAAHDDERVSEARDQVESVLDELGIDTGATPSSEPQEACRHRSEEVRDGLTYCARCDVRLLDPLDRDGGRPVGEPQKG